MEADSGDGRPARQLTITVTPEQESFRKSLQNAKDRTPSAENKTPEGTPDVRRLTIDYAETIAAKSRQQHESASPNAVSPSKKSHSRNVSINHNVRILRRDETTSHLNLNRHGYIVPTERIKECTSGFAVAAFAGLGVIIRIALSELADGFVVYSFLTNLFGCLLLGTFDGYQVVDPFISVGLKTGLCGSITTFGAFNYEISTLIVRSDPKLDKFFLGLCLTLIASALCYYAGEHLGRIIRKLQTAYESNHASDTHHDAFQTGAITVGTPRKHSKGYGALFQWAEVIFIFMAVAIGLSFLFDVKLWLAVLMAPIGACMRWYLAKRFNTQTSFLPYGTLMANLVGSFLVTVILVSFHEKEDPREETLWIEAFTKGFCGCFTTVSAFISEMFIIARTSQLSDTSDTKETINESWDWNIFARQVPIVLFYLTITVCLGIAFSSVPLSIDRFA